MRAFVGCANSLVELDLNNNEIGAEGA